MTSKLDRFSIVRFSIVQGGLLHHFERHLGIVGRVIAFVALTWLPMVILDTFGGRGGLSFQLWVVIPLLVVGPLLIIAEAPISMRVRFAIEQLESRGIVREPNRLSEILEQGKRALLGRIGIVVEIAIMAFIAFRGLEGIDPRGNVEGMGLAGGSTLAAATWFGWVSLPLLLFLRLRWVWRAIVWFQILWRISRLSMNIYPTHADQKGGLAILGRTQEGFGLYWLATSALSSTTIAHRVSLGEKVLQDYYVVVPAVVSLEVLLTLLPLLFFVPALKVARIRGVADYELLSSRYSKDFDPRWMVSSEVPEKQILGNPDFQSLADLGNGYDRISKMGVFPAKAKSAKVIALFGALPFLPLMLMAFPAEKIAKVVIQLIF